MRIFDAAVYMALGGKVHHIVEIVLGEKLIHQLAVADVALDKDATVAVNVLGNGTEVARIGQGIENDYADMLVYPQEILNVVGAYESGGAGYEISLHIVKSCFNEE